MKTIVVVGGNLSDMHKARLEAVGRVTYVEDPSSSDEFLKQTAGTDIILSDGSFLLASLSKLNNVFVAYPFIEIGPFDSEALKKNGVLVANTQGSNRDSIIEWVMWAMLSLFRKFPSMLRVTESFPLELKESLNGKTVLIIGKGNIGTKLGTVCEAFGMKVDFFKKGDDLHAKAAVADVAVNCLNCNSTSKNLLDEKFFRAMKKGAYFISFVRYYTYDIKGLIKAINDGIVAGAGIDCDPEKAGDTTNAFYQKALSCPQILVTPHVAFSTKQAVANGAEFAVQNIEAFVAGTPKNILTKT